MANLFDDLIPDTPTRPFAAGIVPFSPLTLAFSPIGQAIGQRIQQAGASLGRRLGNFFDDLIPTPQPSVRGRLVSRPSDFSLLAHEIPAAIAETIPTEAAKFLTPQALMQQVLLGTGVRGLAETPLGQFPLERLPGLRFLGRFGMPQVFEPITQPKGKNFFEDILPETVREAEVVEPQKMLPAPSEHFIDSADVVGKNLEAAFRDPRTGRIFKTGVVHDIDKIPAQLADEELAANEQGKNILQSGFVNQSGQFVDRSGIVAEGASLPYEQPVSPLWNQPRELRPEPAVSVPALTQTHPSLTLRPPFRAGQLLGDVPAPEAPVVPITRQEANQLFDQSVEPRPGLLIPKVFQHVPPEESATATGLQYWYKYDLPASQGIVYGRGSPSFYVPGFGGEGTEVPGVQELPRRYASIQPLVRVRQQAIRLVANELREQAAMMTGESQRLIQEIRQSGGINPNLGGGIREEILTTVPKALIRTTGRAIDELAADLATRGFPIETSNDLLQALSSIKGVQRPTLASLRQEAQRIVDSEPGGRILEALHSKSATNAAVRRVVQDVTRQLRQEAATGGKQVRGLMRVAQQTALTPTQLARIARVQRLEPPTGTRQAEQPLSVADITQIQARAAGIVPRPFQPTGTPPRIPASKALVTLEAGPQGRDLTPFQKVQLSLFDPSRAAQQLDGRPFGPTTQRVVRPLRSGELAGLQEKRSLITDLRKTSGNMQPGSRESELVAELLEGTRQFVSDPRVSRTAEWMRQHFDDLLAEVNQTRQSLGQRPILRREGYMTHLNNPDVVQAFKEALFGEPLSTKASQTMAGKAADFIRSRVPFFRFGLPRRGGSYAMDAITAFEHYADAALRVKHLSLPGKLASVYVDRTMARFPNAQQYFRRYIEAVVSRKPGEFASAFPQPVRAGVRWLKSRFGKGTILGNLSSVLQQPFTIPATVSATSPQSAALAAKWLAEGDGQAFSKAWFPTVQARLLESDISYGTLMSKWEQALATPFAALDQTMVSHAALSGYLEAVRHGVPFDQAIREGDQVALRTQSSFLRADLAPAFQDEVASGFVQFQNTINGLFNYLKFDLPREGNPLRSAALFAGTLASLMGLYQALGFPHPDRLEDFIPGLSSLRGGPPAGRMVGALANLGSQDPNKRSEALRTLQSMGAAVVFGAGGGQLAKTVRGAVAVGRGGKYNARGRLQFRIQGPVESMRALAFGPYGTKAGYQYIHRGFKPEPLTPQQRLIQRQLSAMRRSLTK